MKVTHFFRDRREGNFSIEGLFSRIREGIKAESQVELNEFYCRNKNRWKDIFKVHKFQGDINHITGDVNFLAFGLNSKNTIITVHDIGHYEQTLKGLKKQIYKYFWLYYPLRKVKHITAISEFTKQRLIHYLNIPENKITVIHNPFPEEFRFKSKKFNSEKPVILQIGSGRNKNIEGLIKAISGINCKLLLVRKPNETLKKTLEKFNIDFEFRYNLTSQEIYHCYLESDIVYFASTYEGFGLPIVEGNAVGRPVITSNITSMPEIAGDAACIVDPYNVESIRTGIIRIIKNEDYRERLIQKGLQNLQRFETGKICDEYLKLYKSLTGK